ncbi:SGNH/GDSL hydrolase family protein [Thioalkalivibrio sp. XN279]|uniref:SGNH/GDSL hydrolase family protein n=1 Tax=Thioalkalivibrio sp. XN279 TaxID=2714953 RepID=UPI00140BEF6F|nr:SGNH/GDSL hydrolase family protein [Thioalkalivibrio sp. XN279]NHA15097.1 SGNH/GDSL hydrolase family protein [Thioalkalivibrio sp. XN279]
MDYRYAAMAMAPLLLAQGLRVRRTAMRLPEPPGPRSGTAGEGTPLRLLVAGDSAAAGVGAASQDEGLSGAIVGALQGRFRVSWEVRATTGLRTAQVLRRLESGAAAPFDVAVMSLGVNDVTGGTRSADFVAQQVRLAALLQSRYAVRLTVLTGLPPMHAFPALPQPLRWVLGERARAFTRLLESVAESAPGCVVLTPRLPLDVRYIAVDGYHPGPLAYAEWGREVAELVVRQFGSG